jgi:phosphonate transport system substrate-binding protein
MLVADAIAPGRPDAGDEIARRISSLTGYNVRTEVSTSYSDLVEAMGDGKAHIGWLSPVAYIIAHQKGFADAALITTLHGADSYGIQFIANVEAGFTVYFDPSVLGGAGISTADAATALAQFSDKKPCFDDPLSLSGYVVPLGLLNRVGVKTMVPATVEGHSTIVSAVYLSPKGEICDFGATVIDARSRIAVDHKDVNEKVLVIWRTEPLIPNDGIAYAVSLPEDMRTKLSEAFLALVKTEEGKTLLQSYPIDGFKVVDDSFYNDIRSYIGASGIALDRLVR